MLLVVIIFSNNNNYYYYLYKIEQFAITYFEQVNVLSRINYLFIINLLKLNKLRKYSWKCETPFRKLFPFYLLFQNYY